MDGECSLLERSLDALGDIFYVYDANGRLVHWNRRLNELFGLSDAELEGMLPAAFFIEADRPAVNDAVAEVFETGVTVVEARAETSEGLVRFELTGRKLLDGEDVIGFSGVARDVTDRRDQEWLLATRNERLSEFADVLAHDLRNPLAVARGNLELYRTGGDPATLESVEGALDRIDAIIADIRTTARDGIPRSELVEVSLPEVAERAWQAVVSGTGTLDVRTDGSVAADPAQLQRVFENLFRNCIEHGPHGVTVAIVETPTGFAVEDDGPGLSSVDRAEALQPGVSGSDDGTGLGLYIVRSVAEFHGWTVVLSERPGAGLRVEFDLESA
ncbi:ATP-binding protein [Natronomonas gomsonensis]|uniref:ATP-binding protein n=1 Tax=Natronomonas gomsonensis TaxID=1046043 RepID=UPI0015B97DE9|nr:PAS domain-containing sensor histidine kinase [Natronomonas gomsonensis]